MPTACARWAAADESGVAAAAGIVMPSWTIAPSGMTPSGIAPGGTAPFTAALLAAAPCPAWWPEGRPPAASASSTPPPMLNSRWNRTWLAATETLMPTMLGRRPIARTHTETDSHHGSRIPSTGTDSAPPRR